MRPGDFSPGNPFGAHPVQRVEHSFNEAGGFLPRKRAGSAPAPKQGRRCFNEAGGFLPRKPMGNAIFTTPIQTLQ